MPAITDRCHGIDQSTVANEEVEGEMCALPRGHAGYCSSRPLPKSTQKLVATLVAEGAPAWLVEMAQRNEFHDFLTSSATPMHDLILHAHACALPKIVEAVHRGDFDAGPDDGWKKPRVHVARWGGDVESLKDGAVNAKGFVAYAREYNHKGTIITKAEAIDLVKKWREQWPEIAELFKPVVEMRCAYCGCTTVEGHGEKATPCPAPENSGRAHFYVDTEVKS